MSIFSLQHSSLIAGFVPGGRGSAGGLSRVEEPRLFRDIGKASPEAQK
jgi:hypothetical protein